MANAKTIGFILIIFGLSLIPYFHEDIREGQQAVWAESENAREIYTGKTRAVYEPLDQAYQVTDKLKEMVAAHADKAPAQLDVWPVVSIWVDPKELNDPKRGIFANPFKSGKLWERASYVSYFEGGEKLFGSYAGIRVHGGESRRNEDRSVRLYFKKKYGEREFLEIPEIAMSGKGPIKRLLLRRDTNYNFVGDFSFSVIRKLGGLAPNYKHVAVYINGKFHDWSQMMEHPHRDNAKRLFGHDNFVYYKLKGDNDSEDHLLYENAIHRLKYAPEPINYKEVEAAFDLENFTANLLTIMYTGNSDWAQGNIIKDQNDPKGKWKIISWDFDRTFYPVMWKSHRKKLENFWELGSFYVGMKQHDASLRSRMFNRLIKETSEYKKYFVSKVEELFEEVLTPEFIQEKTAHYQKLAAAAGNPKEMTESIEKMQVFIKNRKAVFCRDMKKWIGEVAPTCHKL